MKEEGGDDVDDDGGSRKISITIYLISCKKIKKTQIIAYRCILFFKKNIKWGKSGVAVCVAYRNLLTGSI
jgi:hypothetical protein